MDDFTFKSKYNKLEDGNWKTSKVVHYGRRAARRTQKVHLWSALTEYRDLVSLEPYDCMCDFCMGMFGFDCWEED